MSQDYKRIQNFEIKKIEIKGIELLPQAIGIIDIYEGITNPGILGTISIADWQGFNEVGQITANDDLIITFSTIERDELKLKYKIYASDTGVNSLATFQPLTYKFCSPWLIDAFTRQISKNYKEKYIHEIIKDLLTECGATIGVIEKTKQKLFRFTSPLWTPLRTIHHLLSFAMNEDDKGGYVFWTDMKTGNVNVTTMDYLFQGKYGKEDCKFMSIPPNQFYESKVGEVSIETDFDIIKSLNQGMTKSINQSYYYDKNKIFKFEDGIEKIPHTHLSQKLPVNSVFNNKKYFNITGNYLYPIKDSLVTDDNEMKDMIDGKAKTRYVRLFADIFKLNFITLPNSSRRAGNLAELEYQSENKNIVAKNKQYSGMYVIRNIRHMFTGKSYTPAVTLIADGLKENKNKLIEWG